MMNNHKTSSSDTQSTVASLRESMPVLPHPTLALLADLVNSLKAVDADYEERDSYKAAIALLAGEQREPAADADAPTAQRFYAVTGRIPEDEEDVTYIYQAFDREHAVTQFTDDLWSAEVDLDRGRINKVHGTDVFIDGVVVSDTPITEA